MRASRSPVHRPGSATSAGVPASRTGGEENGLHKPNDRCARVQGLSRSHGKGRAGAPAGEKKGAPPLPRGGPRSLPRVQQHGGAGGGRGGASRPVPALTVGSEPSSFALFSEGEASAVSQLLGWLLVLLLVLGVLAVVGHGLWLLFAAIGRALTGGERAAKEERCVGCRR